ncbi:unnamed protein product, partial [Medioppia subpectinata]
KQQLLTLEPSREVTKQYRPKTKLELEVAELLGKSENNLTDDKPLTVAEEKIMKAMSLEEAKLRHKELQKMRALLSYEEVKLKRQAKIKSKRYHRILKREKLKKSVEEFEDIKKTDPKAAIDKLQELDKLRALERASLKHKNTGKWAKHLKLRAQYDDSARIALTEQLQISNKLTQKRVHFEDDEEVDKSSDNESDSDDNNDEDVPKDNEFEPLPEDYNPWMKSGRQSKPNTQPIEEEKEEAEDEPINFETSGSPTHESIQPINTKRNETINDKKSKTVEPIPKEAEIDPNDFIVVKANKIKSSFPDLVTEMDSDAESVDESDGISDDEQRQLVSEAFADDDVMSDFKSAKKERIENESAKDINLHLPGWGSWAGNGVKQSKRKRKKFTIKAKTKERKDGNIGNVIISEKNDDIIAKHRVNQLPFPFKNVEEFENSIRLTLQLNRFIDSMKQFHELIPLERVSKHFQFCADYWFRRQKNISFNENWCGIDPNIDVVHNSYTFPKRYLECHSDGKLCLIGSKQLIISLSEKLPNVEYLGIGHFDTNYKTLYDILESYQSVKWLEICGSCKHFTAQQFRHLGQLLSGRVTKLFANLCGIHSMNVIDMIQEMSELTKLLIYIRRPRVMIGLLNCLPTSIKSLRVGSHYRIMIDNQLVATLLESNAKHVQYLYLNTNRLTEEALELLINKWPKSSQILNILVSMARIFEIMNTRKSGHNFRE